MAEPETRKNILQEKIKITKKHLLGLEKQLKDVEWEIIAETCGVEISCENCKSSTLVVAGDSHNLCLEGECVLCMDKCKDFSPDTSVSKYLKSIPIYQDDYYKIESCFGDNWALDKNLDRIIKLMEVIK